jgi:hypothetical protein
VFLKYGRNIEYAAPSKYLDDPKAVRESKITYLNFGFKLGVEPIRGFKLDARIRGAHVGYGQVRICSQDSSLAYGDAGCVHGADGTIGDITGDPTSDPTNIPKPGNEGWDVSNELTVTFERKSNWFGVQRGRRVKFSYEYAVPHLSDFHYYRVGAELFRGWQVLEHHNLVLRSSLNVGHHLPFQQELLTGGTNARGWLNNQFRGDFQALGTMEYSLPLFEIYGFSVRGLGFWDSSYTTFLATDNPERNYLCATRSSSCTSLETRGLAPFKNSVGVGTRLLLRQIVLPLLGLDLGYGLESRDVQVYLAIGLTD